MKTVEEFTHLGRAAREAIALSTAERVRQVQALKYDAWIPYTNAKIILKKMDEL